MYKSILLTIGLCFGSIAVATEQSRFQCEGDGLKAMAFINTNVPNSLVDSMGAKFFTANGDSITRMFPHKDQATVVEDGANVREVVGTYSGISTNGNLSLQELRDFAGGIFYDPNINDRTMKRFFNIAIRVRDAETPKTAKLYYSTLVAPNFIPAMTDEQRYFIEYGSNRRSLRLQDPDYLVRAANVVLECVEIKR